MTDPLSKLPTPHQWVGRPNEDRHHPQGGIT